MRMQREHEIKSARAILIMNTLGLMTWPLDPRDVAVTGIPKTGADRYEATPTRRNAADARQLMLRISI